MRALFSRVWFGDDQKNNRKNHFRCSPKTFLSRSRFFRLAALCNIHKRLQKDANAKPRSHNETPRLCVLFLYKKRCARFDDPAKTVGCGSGLRRRRRRLCTLTQRYISRLVWRCFLCVCVSVSAHVCELASRLSSTMSIETVCYLVVCFVC